MDTGYTNETVATTYRAQFLDDNNYLALHTYGNFGFSYCVCEVCGTTLGGDRFPAFILTAEGSGAELLRKEDIGDICTGCANHFNTLVTCKASAIRR